MQNIVDFICPGGQFDLRTLVGFSWSCYLVSYYWQIGGYYELWFIYAEPFQPNYIFYES